MVNYENIDWYLAKIKEEYYFAKEENYTGNIEVMANFKNGEIANVNFGAKRCVKRQEGS